jgi:DNA-binding XRE family transcriptional regulator
MRILSGDNNAPRTCGTFVRVLHFVAQIMNRFTTLREDFNLTQRQLAELLGVARNTVARWEVGICNPPKIAELALQALRPMLRKRLEYKRSHGS